MYLTTHRVRAESGATGYNGFLYLHGDEPVPDILDRDRVGEEPPGECVAEILTVQPGGNEVDSYLDLVGPDTADLDDLDHALGEFSEKISREGSDDSAVWTGEQFAGRFFATDRTPGSPFDEFNRLFRVSLNLLSQHLEGEQPSLMIVEERNPPRWTYRVTEESASHIPPDENYEEGYIPNVEMLDRTRDGFEQTHGSIYPMLVDLMFPPESEAPEYFSRVVVKSESGETLWRSDQK